MSKTATRYLYSTAYPIARRVHALILEGGAPRAEIAGSIRRGRPDVGDIDIVLESHPDDIYAAMRIGQALGESGFHYMPTRFGPATIHLESPGAPAIDLYLATPATWAITLLVRTGSAAHNFKLARAAQVCLPARKLAVSRGILDSAGRVIPTEGEADIFRVLGLKYVEPKDREAPEFERYINAEDPA